MTPRFEVWRTWTKLALLSESGDNVGDSLAFHWARNLILTSVAHSIAVLEGMETLAADYAYLENLSSFIVVKALSSLIAQTFC